MRSNITGNVAGNILDAKRGFVEREGESGPTEDTGNAGGQDHTTAASPCLSGTRICGAINDEERTRHQVRRRLDGGLPI